jgi:hypothetical protein
MLPLAGNEEFRVRGRGRVRVRSKNENDSEGPRERKPRPRRGSFLVARNRSSIVLVLVLVSAIGCKGEDVGVPKSNKLALMGLKPWAESYSPSVGATNHAKIFFSLAPFDTDTDTGTDELRPITQFPVAEAGNCRGFFGGSRCFPEPPGQTRPGPGTIRHS